MSDLPLHFEHPTWLDALFLLLPLIGLLFYSYQVREKILQKIMASHLRERLLLAVSLPKKIVRDGLLLCALGMAVIALASPEWGYHQEKITAHGHDVILAIDTSRSMLATDLSPTRLSRAQLLGEDILELLPGDRLGLIAFAGSAFLQTPLTLDHNAMLDALQELDTKLIPKGGTNITAAINIAIEAFGKGEGAHRALIIITDGEDLEEDSLAAARQAQAAGIKIFTIGMGSAEGSLIPIKTEDGNSDFVRDHTGKPVLSKLDAHRLQEIASMTGGFYQAFNTNAGKEVVDRGILSMETHEQEILAARKPIKRYAWPVAISLGALLLWALIGDRRSRHALIKRAFLFLSFLGISCFFSPHLEASSGMKAYQAGDYQKALNDFESRIQKGNQQPELLFDAGTAAYKKLDYQKAIDYFTAGMSSDSAKIQHLSTYNLANALVRLGEEAPEVKEKKSYWKNAIEHYNTVIKEDPTNNDAKENREIVKKLLEQLKKHPPQPQNQQNQQQQPQQGNQGKGKDQQQNQQSQPPQNQQNQQNGSSAQNPSQQSPQQPTPTPNASPTPSHGKNGDGIGGNGQPTPSQDGKEGSSSNSEKHQGESGGASPSPSSSPTASPENSPGNSSAQGSSGEGSPTPSQDGSNNRSDDGRQNKSELPTPGAGSPTASPTPSGKLSGAVSGGGPKGPNQAALQAALGKKRGDKGMMTQDQAEALLRSLESEEAKVEQQERSEEEEVDKDW